MHYNVDGMYFRTQSKRHRISVTPVVINRNLALTKLQLTSTITDVGGTGHEYNDWCAFIETRGLLSFELSTMMDSYHG